MGNGMTNTEWSYSVGLMVPAELVSKDPAAIEALVQRDLGGVRSLSMYRTATAAALNPLNACPAVRVGDAPDIWHVRDPGADTFALVPDGSGQAYQITQAYREMTYQEAKSQARGIIAAYLQSYRLSQFNAAGFTFSADADHSVVYNVLDTFIRTNGTTIDYWIFDVDDIEHHFGTSAEWEAFTAKWRNLWFDAQEISLTAWQAIRDTSTTAAEVEAVIEGLPAIPGAV